LPGLRPERFLSLLEPRLEVGEAADLGQVLLGVDLQQLKTVNVLEDDEIRQGIKEYSNWPTIPQLYVKGEFIGGSDIMMEMYQSGELQQVLTAQN